METQLTYNNARRHLGIRFRERYTTPDGLQAKVRVKLAALAPAAPHSTARARIGGLGARVVCCAAAGWVGG